MKLTDRMAYSLTLPMATRLCFRIIDDGILTKRYRAPDSDKRIALFDELDLDQVKRLRKALDWAIERMELDMATEARLGPPGCIEDNRPAGEYGRHSKEVKAIDLRHGVGGAVGPG
jgi:hypothetical protein